MTDKMMELNREYESLSIPGYRGTVVYKADNDPNEFHMAVLFDSAEAYKANAADPAQNERYERYREILAAEPEWHDGAVVYQFMS